MDSKEREVDNNTSTSITGDNKERDVDNNTTSITGVGDSAARPSRVSEDDRKKLHKATHDNEWWKVYGLCSKEASLLKERNTSSKEDTPLHLAARKGYFFFDKLVDLGVSKGLKAQEMLGVANKVGDTPLHDFARASRDHSDLDLPKCCHDKDFKIQGNKDFRQVNERNESLLYLAVRSGRRQLANLLIGDVESKEERPDDCGPGDSTALHAAMECGHPDVLNQLLKRPPKCSELLITEKNWKPVQLAVERNNVDVIKVLKENYGRLKNDDHGCLKEVKNKDGQNILHAAIKLQKMETIKYMLEDDYFSDLISDRDDKGDTPLHIAARTCNPEIIRLLLNEAIGADRFLKNESSQWPVEVFCKDVKQTTSLNWKESFELFKREYPNFNMEEQLSRDTTELDDKLVQLIQNYVSNVSVIATLICTVTFAAAFTVPGGFTGEGSPVLWTKAAFTAFTISNTAALCFSLTVAFHSIFAPVKDVLSFFSYKRTSNILLLLAFMAMIATFGTGSYVVLVEKRRWLAVFSLGTCCSFPVVVLAAKKKTLLVRILSWRKKLSYWIRNLAFFVAVFVLIGPVTAFYILRDCAECLRGKERAEDVADDLEERLPEDLEDII